LCHKASCKPSDMAQLARKLKPQPLRHGWTPKSGEEDWSYSIGWFVEVLSLSNFIRDTVEWLPMPNPRFLRQSTFHGKRHGGSFCICWNGGLVSPSSS
jgi:hypothetical protein